MIEPTLKAPPQPVISSRLQPSAQAFEAAFLTQMMVAAGVGKATAAIGGIGEAQFASLLVGAQAERMAARGGIGIAEMIVRHYAQDNGQ